MPYHILPSSNFFKVLMVGSQTTNVTPNFVLGYNIYFTSPNEKCKFIFYINILNLFYDIQNY
jgi:hypothetical protein